ncbi:hypothetical protein Csa_013998 [Cucumis sativus]|uniref:Uncharacterized protein n=1 Tax=Cucumis sativus TaxID=3659 RepID=A0A0A0LW05_CUCSA|nr:hypothetical protein Csa_013998 [Cucumis sativus]
MKEMIGVAFGRGNSLNAMGILISSASPTTTACYAFPTVATANGADLCEVEWP